MSLSVAFEHPTPAPAAVEDSPSSLLIAAEDHARLVRTVQNLVIFGYVMLGLFVTLVCYAAKKSKPVEYDPIRRRSDDYQAVLDAECVYEPVVDSSIQ